MKSKYTSDCCVEIAYYSHACHSIIVCMFYDLVYASTLIILVFKQDRIFHVY